MLVSKVEVMSCFCVHCFREVAKAVARLIALALDLDVRFFDKQEMLGEAIATLRLLHYEGLLEPLESYEVSSSSLI